MRDGCIAVFGHYVADVTVVDVRYIFFGILCGISSSFSVTMVFKIKCKDGSQFRYDRASFQPVVGKSEAEFNVDQHIF